MKFVDEFRDPARVKELSAQITGVVTQPWTIMEVCGGQTHAIVKHGLDQLLPEEVTLVHGPGCPVCVTSQSAIDKAVEIAMQPNTILCSFGDMMRVPGSATNLISAKAHGADVHMVYSPLDSLTLARQNPEAQVVFFAVGFETTAPATALAIEQAEREGLTNLSFLVCHVLVPPAMEAILSADSNTVQGFLAAGHVCAVMGYREYEPIARKYNVPIVVTGFEPLDILQGVYLCLRQLEDGRAEVENQYVRSVQAEGNRAAQTLMQKVFKVETKDWRGIGGIPASGLALSDAYADFCAERRFGNLHGHQPEQTECQSGLVLQGALKPSQCPAFGTKCTPERPLGAPMVSSEGACAAYYQHRPHSLQRAVNQ